MRNEFNLVSYEGNTISELKENFKIAVDDYIITCKEINKTPQKAYSGTFNVRISSEMHHILAHEAQLNNISINSYIKNILDKYIKTFVINTK